MRASHPQRGSVGRRGCGEDLALSLSVPDVHLISLDPGCEGLIVPSKVSGILAAGRPVHYLGNPEGERGRSIHGRGVGICFDPAAPETCREAIEVIAAAPERRRTIGQRARALSEAYAPSRARASWEAVLTYTARGSAR